MRKRKPPIAKSLANNSVSGMFSAIEIHNKPTIKYRYEMVVLLVLNSWELLLKGYLYKYHKDVKLFQKDGTTKPFDNCVNIVNEKIGRDFNPIQENLNVLYKYRNQVSHFYIEELDPVVFSLVSKNILFYSDFLLKYFKIDISKESDLVLLPIGFKKPTSPIDYISSTSFNEKASFEVKTFIQSIINATQRLNNNNIDETIFVEFRMNLINVNKVKNADLIAGIDNSIPNNFNFTVRKESKNVTVSSDGEKIAITTNKKVATGTLYYEELQEGIFDEINNIIDANRLLSRGEHKFMLGASIYYRIYSERQHVNYSIEIFDLLARAAAMDFYAPFLYWLTKLPPNIIANILFDIFKQSKSPKVHNLVKIIILLGNDAVNIFSPIFEEKYRSSVQKPDFYYTYMKLLTSKKSNPILKVLKAPPNKILIDNHSYVKLLKDNNIPLQILSRECLHVFKGNFSQRSITRELDFLTYGQYLLNNQGIIEQLQIRAISDIPTGIKT